MAFPILLRKERLMMYRLNNSSPNLKVSLFLKVAQDEHFAETSHKKAALGQFLGVVLFGRPTIP
jgi:hypothetical protein